jgi:hypothetical protein
MRVAVAVAVGVGVSVGVAVLVGVLVGVEVGVAVGVLVGAEVAVAVGDGDVWAWAGKMPACNSGLLHLLGKLDKVTAPETAVNNFNACLREIVGRCSSLLAVIIPPKNAICTFRIS